MAAKSHPRYKVAAVQAAPVFLDLDATVDKTVALMKEAAGNGAKLIAFPETWIPGYPFHIWLDSPAWGMQFVQRYHDNSLVVGSAEFQRICDAAREFGIWVGLGFSEKSGGSLYMGQVLIDGGPSFSLYRGAASALGPDLNNAASQIYAAEGQCFVLAPCAVVSPQMSEILCTDDTKRQLLKVGGGFARIYAPDGSSIGQALAEDQEGIVYADIDLGMISLAKAAADPAGHYARPDVTRLLLNKTPGDRVVYRASAETLLNEPGDVSNAGEVVVPIKGSPLEKAA